MQVLTDRQSSTFCPATHTRETSDVGGLSFYSPDNMVWYKRILHAGSTSMQINTDPHQGWSHFPSQWSLGTRQHSSNDKTKNCERNCSPSFPQIYDNWAKMIIPPWFLAVLFPIEMLAYGLTSTVITVSLKVPPALPYRSSQAWATTKSEPQDPTFPFKETSIAEGEYSQTLI